MSPITGVWLRREASPTEERTPLTPADAARLIAGGLPVAVERSEQRAFDTDAYAAAGCRVVAADSWSEAPDHYAVLGLKEPVARPADLTHQHIFFGHAYKGQAGGPALLNRFAAGGGRLLDLECLTDESGRRLAAFGYWAGYVGAALAVLHRRGRLSAPLRSMAKDELDAALSEQPGGASALVIGALGRSGRGARAALETAGLSPSLWDVEETRDLDKAALLGHDILVNTVFASEPGPAFLDASDLDRPDRVLSVVSDVTCDITSDCNRLPVNDKPTDWAEPVRVLRPPAPGLDVIAIENLPSLLPRESSTAFSADLLPHLATLPSWSPVWDRCAAHFRQALPTPTADRGEVSEHE
ncbi:saccharopine dehydrogenase [Actinacidiphila yeochonensis]|uniref:saccharopine dehydrogenase n=1 Tax=Actinacidiphila yeochonensis TaxID=89050 RepID=UPI00055E1925|nr:saccharopine dehydrogenase [Actinacidiphila yeochonensis]